MIPKTKQFSFRLHLLNLSKRLPSGVVYRNFYRNKCYFWLPRKNPPTHNPPGKKIQLSRSTKIWIAPLQTTTATTTTSSKSNNRLRLIAKSIRLSKLGSSLLLLDVGAEICPSTRLETFPSRGNDWINFPTGENIFNWKCGIGLFDVFFSSLAPFGCLFGKIDFHWYRCAVRRSE